MAYEVKSTLPDEDQRKVGQVLQSTLVDLVDLSLVAKQIHWNVYGPRFRSVHLQLDDVVETARNYTDIVAERASAVGVPPDGRARSVSSGSGIAPVQEGWLEDKDAVPAMVAALTAVIGRARDNMKTIGPVDPVTEDIFIQIAADLEKHHWMFQAENVR